MVRLSEENIEEFIRKNKSKFEVYPPPDKNMDRFFLKLNYHIKHMISIVPYLIRVTIATVIIFTVSVIVWNNYIRKDRYEISLGKKITLVIERVKTEKNN
jgi:hypothetical protein